MGESKEEKPKLIFALAGELVTKSVRAREIWRAAIRTDKHWLIPQALSVSRQLERVEANNFPEPKL